MKFPTLLVVLAACAAPETYDVVLANGRVMDPASGLDSVRHIGLRAGKIAAISAAPLRGDTVVDVTGHVVVLLWTAGKAQIAGAGGLAVPVGPV